MKINLQLMKAVFAGSFLLGTLTGVINGQTTFSWTGGNQATPWYDDGNWDDNGAPNQTDGGGSGTTLGTEEENAVVVFDAEVASGGYMPTDTLRVSTDWFGSGASDHLMPALRVLNGTINLGNPGDVWWHYAGGNVYEIGDGDLRTEARLNTAFQNWVRHRDRGGFVLIVINRDGTMNQTANFEWGQNGDARMTLSGGTFVSSGTIKGLATRENSFVSFDAGGSAFTAPFGDGVETDFADLAAVNAAVGDSFINNTAEELAVIDNGDGTFTVSTGGSAGGDPGINLISVEDGLASVAMTGRDNVDYWLASSDDLSLFESEESLYLDSGLTTLAPSPFQMTSGELTLYFGTSGSPRKFLRIQDSDPGL